MFNPGFEDDLYKDRSQSFRRAVRAPRKNQRYMTSIENEDTQSSGTSSKERSQINYANPIIHKPKYNWKSFLPWATKSKSYPPKHPVDDCGFISLVLLSWLTPIMKKGFKDPLEISDLGKLSRNDSCAVNFKRLNRFWMEEIREKGIEDASIAKALLRSIRTRLVVSALVFLLSLLLSFVGPTFLINRLLRYVEQKHDSLASGLGLVAGLLVAEICRSWIQSLSFLLNIRTGVRARAMVWTMVYNKMSRLKNAGDKSIGELVNICANDAQRVFEACLLGPFIVGGPVALTVVIGYTTYVLGPSALLGCFIFLAMFPIQAVVGRLSGKFRGQAVRVTDQRVKLMNEVLNCIKLIKMYAWEKSFAKVIGEIRDQEKKVLGYTSVLQSLNLSMTNVVATFSTVVTFIVHVYTGNDLLASQAFTVIAVFNTMIFAFAVLPFAVRNIAEAKVSMKRLQSLLVMEEYEPWVEKPADENVVVEMKHANFGWYEVKMKKQQGATAKSKSEKDNARQEPPAQSARGGPRRVSVPQEFKTRIVPTLFDVNITLKKGTLVGVCGGVGSGKSSLINAILAQMNLTEGEVAVAGSVAYVAQQAWLMNATVKENILFGQAFKPKMYDKVLTSCTLKKDFEIFAHGDETEIGERGINLSGGQKQRISLARAVYADKDVYLLDDPLSAVDSHVGSHIFDSCIKGVLSGKTIMFVTHQLQYLNRCDSVIFMKDGRFAEMGKYEQLINDGKEFSSLMEVYNKKKEAEEESEDDEEDVQKVLEVIVRKRTLSRRSLGKLEEVKEIQEKEKTQATERDGFADKVKPCGKDNMMKTEDRKMGAVALSTYASYVKAGGGYFVGFGIFLLMIIIIISRAFTDFWLGQWINDGNGNKTSTDSAGKVNDNPQLDFYAIIYGSSLVLSCVLLTFKCFVYISTVLRASSNLHNRVFHAVTRSPMRFFDTTPIGQILNRFSKDIDEIDTKLPFLIEALMLNLLFISATIVIISVVFPWFLIALFVLMIFFFWLNIFFRRSIREIKRLDNVTRSPIFSHISTSVQGLSTLHAYDKTETFSQKFENLLDTNSLPFFIFASSSRWLATRLDMVSAAVITTTALLIVILRDSVPAAMGGLAIAYAIRVVVLTDMNEAVHCCLYFSQKQHCLKNLRTGPLTVLFKLIAGLLQFTVRLSTETEAMFTGIERLLHYIQNLEQEAPTTIPDKKPDDNWPEKGQLSILGLKMRYRDNLPLALKGITCNIKAQEKIGIVGRTGSGKSSIGVALFRLVEPTDGTIKIDGVNILEIGLDDLRSKLSIIPQDPVLFIGTIRYNLDPFNKYTDEELWTALERAHLKDTVSNLPLKLLAPVVENGENFSVGERQLMCMARALLRNCKILMLDEATAAIDSVTDAKIQDTIREAFKGCTLLTIAHRLNTVMDSDRIMVLEEGEIVEFDKPSTLLAREDSLFSSLVRAVEKSHKQKDSLSS